MTEKRGHVYKTPQEGYFHITNFINVRIKYLIVSYKLSLCLTKYHTMKAYWGLEVQLHAFFDLGTRWR